MVDIYCISQKQREYVEKLQAEIDALEQKLGYAGVAEPLRYAAILATDTSYLPETK